MTGYIHQHRRETGTVRDTSTSVQVRLPADVRMSSAVLGWPGGAWRGQMSIGSDLTVHPDDVETLRRFAAAATQLADDWGQVLADDGAGSAEVDR